MNINNEALDTITKKLIKAKFDIKTSNHDRLCLRDCDIEASDDSVWSWAESLEIGIPSDSHFYVAKELPEEYLEEIFGETTTQEEMNAIHSKPEYKALFELYKDVFRDMYIAAAEQEAYYQNEYQENENYHYSMRSGI